MSTISIEVGTILAEWINLSISYNLGSGTFMVPRLDLEEVKAVLWISARVLEIQLNNVVFPLPAKPMIPHLSAIYVAFREAKIGKIVAELFTVPGNEIFPE
jgi:hypothetical protein